MSRALVNDLVESFKYWRLWSTLGWHDILVRYRNTVIGPFWLTLSLGIFVVTLGILYSALFNMEIRGYLQYIAAGLIVWTLISTIILDGCNVFIEGESVIKQVYMPLPIFVLRVVCRNLIIFAHNIPIFALSMLAFLMPVSMTAFLSLVGILLIVLTSVWVILVIGFFSTRFRDIIPIISSVLQILFFITPVFWRPEMFTGARKILIDINPLFHFIEIVRQPLLGEIPAMSSYLYVIAFTAVGWIFTCFFYARFRNRVVYWI
jgi:ABC-type polysaccharide/polyol phosphate export permease